MAVIFAYPSLVTKVYIDSDLNVLSIDMWNHESEARGQHIVYAEEQIEIELGDQRTYTSLETIVTEWLQFKKDSIKSRIK